MSDIKFHFTRVRPQGTTDWFDPNTDIRKVLPQVFAVACTRLLDTMEPDTEDYDAVLYIKRCTEIFELRVLEDKSPLREQLAEFFSAIAKAPTNVSSYWQGLVVQSIMCMYALFCRRDAVTDSESLHGMIDYAWLSPLKELVSAATWESIRRDLGSRASLLVQTKTQPGGQVVCEETGETVLENAKRIAFRLVSQSGALSWDELADACDEAFEAADSRNEAEATALALAYPSYKHMSLTVTKDGSSAKAKEAEGTT